MHFYPIKTALLRATTFLQVHFLFLFLKSNNNYYHVPDSCSPWWRTRATYNKTIGKLDSDSDILFDITHGHL